MLGLIVGASGSYVGEGTVGGGNYIFFTSTGSIAFSGTVPRQVTKSTSGSIAFSGTVPRQVTLVDRINGSIQFSGATGKQQAKTYGGTLSFSGVANAGWSGTTFGFGATGSIVFAGTAEVFNSRIELGGQIQVGSLVGEMSVGYNPIGSYYKLPGLVFTGSAAANKQSTKLVQGGITFSGTTTTTKSATRQSSTLLADRLVFTGTAVVDFTGSTASIWANKLIVSAQTEIVDTTVWDIDDPDNAENLLGAATVWKDSNTPGGIIVEESSAWSI